MFEHQYFDPPGDRPSACLQFSTQSPSCVIWSMHVKANAPFRTDFEVV